MRDRRSIRILKATALPLLAGALLAAPSCTRIESQAAAGHIPMSFGSYVSRPVSKAAAAGVVTNATLPANSSFGVFAFYQPGVVGASTGHWADGGWTPDFMFNQEVAFDGSDYSYSPLRYWPANEENTLSFWAYWPYDLYSADNSGALKFYAAGGTAAYGASSEGLPTVKYTVPQDPAQQYDILFDSFAQTDRIATGGATPGTVPFSFRHALALVEFQIKEGTGALVTSFELSDLAWSGTCADPSTRVWTEQGAVADYVLNNVSADGNVICRLLMMPQALTAAKELTLSYDIQFASSDPNHPEPIVYQGNSGSVRLNDARLANGTGANLTAWEAGRHYVYVINAGFDRIEFEGVVELGEDWTSAGDDNQVHE